MAKKKVVPKKKLIVKKKPIVKKKEVTQEVIEIIEEEVFDPEEEIRMQSELNAADEFDKEIGSDIYEEEVEIIEDEDEYINDEDIEDMEDAIEEVIIEDVKSKKKSIKKSKISKSKKGTLSFVIEASDLQKFLNDIRGKGFDSSSSVSMDLINDCILRIEYAF